MPGKRLLHRHGQPTMTSRIIDTLKADGEMSVFDVIKKLGIFITVQDAIKTYRLMVARGRSPADVSLTHMVATGRHRLITNMMGTLYRDKIVCRVSRGRYILNPEFKD